MIPYPFVTRVMGDASNDGFIMYMSIQHVLVEISSITDSNTNDAMGITDTATFDGIYPMVSV